MPAICRTCIMLPRAPEPTIMSMGLNFWARRSFSMAWRTFSVASVQISTSFWRRSPSVMMPRVEVLLLLLGLLLVLGEDRLLLRRRLDVVDGDGEPRLGGELEAEVLDGVEAVADVGLRVVVGEDVDDLAHVALADDPVDVVEARRQALLEQEPAVGGGAPPVLAARDGVVVGHLDEAVQGDLAAVVGPLGVDDAAEGPTLAGRCPAPPR